MFVVQFDVHKGNVLEWQYPPGILIKSIDQLLYSTALFRV